MNCKRAWASILIATISGYAHAALANQFRFLELEHYYLSCCQVDPAEQDAAQAKLDKYAVQYAERYFPVGSSASAATAALTEAGAKCSVIDDPNDSPGFVCDWSRPDYGLGYFCCQIDWRFVLVTDNKMATLQNIIASRWETGP